MSKIFVDKIQKPSGPELTLPNNLPNGKQYVATDSSGNLVWTSPASLPSVATFTPTGSSPILFCQWANYTNGYHAGNGATFTSELGALYNSQGDYQLGVITGRTTATKGYGRQFAIPPKLDYISGSRGEFQYASEEGGNYADTSSKYNYPDRLLIAMFVKNSTASDITRNFEFRCTSYWNSGYEGAGIFTYIPNATNTQISADPNSVSSLTTTNVWSYTASSTAVKPSVSITVPADKTIAVLLTCTPQYYTQSSGYHFRKAAQVRNFYATTLTTGLAIDVDRTTRALSNPLKSSQLVDIWK